MRHPTPTVDEGFNTFWACYPRHASKKDAQKAWGQLKPSAALLATILAALAWQKTTPQWTKNHGAYVPYAGSWIRGERWDDEPFETRPMSTYEPWTCPHMPHCPHRTACLVVAARTR